MNKLKLALLIISTAIFLIACEDQEKNKLDNRVIDYWNLKINKSQKFNKSEIYPLARPLECGVWGAQPPGKIKKVGMSLDIRAPC